MSTIITLTLRPTTGGLLYHKNKCVWYMKGSDEKKSFSNNWKIDANINAFGMKRI